MLEIVNLIHTKGDPSWVKTVLNWERSPWIEIQEGFDLIKNQKDPRSYNSHLPIQLFPKSFFQSKAKVSYIHNVDGITSRAVLSACLLGTWAICDSVKWEIRKDCSELQCRIADTLPGAGPEHTESLGK